MARYIDADKYVEYLEKGICSKCIDEVCGACGLDSARWIAEEFPTEDVVPRAEVEKLEKENAAFGEIICKQDSEIERLRKELLTKQNLEESYSKSVKVIEKRALKAIEKVKSDVAREIFEEIMYECLLELKKKYIGEEK